MAALFCFRGIHTVRPHIPLIQFPKRIPLESLFSVHSARLVLVKHETFGGNVKKSETKARPSVFNVLEESELPSKYQRASILPEEIENIERGGRD